MSLARPKRIILILITIGCLSLEVKAFILSGPNHLNFKMHLPLPLQNSLEKLFESISAKDLKEASASLSQHYRLGESLSSHAEFLAYLVARLPATYSAVSKVLETLKEYKPRSLLDLGSGPGTAAWAVVELFSEIKELTLIEKDPHFIELGKKLSLFSSHLSQATWFCKDLREYSSFPKHDLVIMSYSYGEFAPCLEVLDKAWEAANAFFVLIEPGTPRGFKNLMQARDFFISRKAHLLAPCPHTHSCPLATNASEWCHFAVRVERSFLHRFVKEGTLPYEDEKFCYLIVSKNLPSTSSSRLLHDTQKRSGHVLLKLCTPQGLQTKVVSKRNKEVYKKAKKASWGDLWAE